MVRVNGIAPRLRCVFASSYQSRKSCDPVKHSLVSPRSSSERPDHPDCQRTKAAITNQKLPRSGFVQHNAVRRRSIPVVQDKHNRLNSPLMKLTARLRRPHQRMLAQLLISYHQLYRIISLSFNKPSAYLRRALVMIKRCSVSSFVITIAPSGFSLFISSTCKSSDAV
ncbi:MAG: hypothetical protein DKINENOH_05634 [bacterium]|nr:hypothetical protein [bacterium]